MAPAVVHLHLLNVTLLLTTINNHESTGIPLLLRVILRNASFFIFWWLQWAVHVRGVYKLTVRAQP